MRIFDLLNMQHVYLFLVPAFVTVLIIGISFGFTHFKSKRSEQRKKEIFYQFPEGLAEGKNPFPLIIYLTIAGTIVWVFFYILAVGLMGKKI